MGESVAEPAGDGDGPSTPPSTPSPPPAARPTGDSAAEDPAEVLRRSLAVLDETERLARIGSWTWEVGSDEISWSAGLSRLLGLEPEDGMVSTEYFVESIHPDDRDRMTRLLRETIVRGVPYDTEMRMTGADGMTRLLQARGEVVEADGDRTTRLGGYVQDITDLHAVQEELARQQRVLRRIARGEPVSATTETLCLEIESQFPGSFCSVLVADVEHGQLRHVAAPSLPPAVVAALDGLPMAVGMGACGTAAARGEVVVVEDATTDLLTAPFRGIAAEHHLESVWSLPLLDSVGTVLGTFALYRSHPHRPDQAELDAVAAAGSIAALAIERSRNEEALTAAASVDPLTALPNRSHFLEQLEARLAQGVEGALAVMFLDLDRFKWINDSLGHPTGDQVLVEVAHRLRRVLRGDDLIARFGGDEFTLLVHDATPEAVEQVATRVKGAFDDPVVIDGGEFFLSVSVGVALATPDASASELVRDADAAMYAAKEAGRSRWALFDHGLRRRALTRLTLEAELRRAIDRDELVMHYQPMRDLSTGRWSGVEALARWQHPSRGLIGPDEFIPLAEETGLIVPLGLKLLDQAVTQAAVWLRSGRKTTMSVNLSVVQLDDPTFPEELRASLRRLTVPAELLVVEITETGVMQRLDSAMDSLERISELGVEVVIDDFGTGYSSLARLREMPVTGVKIDRRFTQGLGEDAGVDAVLRAITDLAHALELEVVAEGIETEAALAAAAELGADHCQGYYLARPAPASDIERLLS